MDDKELLSGDPALADEAALLDSPALAANRSLSGMGVTSAEQIISLSTFGVVKGREWHPLGRKPQVPDGNLSKIISLAKAKALGFTIKQGEEDEV